MAQVAVKVGLREAEPRPAGGGAAEGERSYGDAEMPRRGALVGVCVYTHAHTRLHINLAPCLHSVNLIHSLK